MTSTQPSTVAQTKAIRRYTQWDGTRFATHLNSAFMNRINLSKVLSDTNAIIAGGAVLSHYAGYVSNDLDIYVNQKNSRSLIHQLTHPDKYLFKKVMSHIASPYDDSFFKKNNIIARIALKSNVSDSLYMSIDVMIIPDHVPLTKVVTNFDLSFCEIWYNGKHVYVADPDGVRTKRDELKPDYRRAYYLRNHFIHERIRKYLARKFIIDAVDLDILLVKKPPLKVVANPEEWVVKKLLYSAAKKIDILDVINIPEFTVQAFESYIFPLIKKAHPTFEVPMLFYMYVLGQRAGASPYYYQPHFSTYVKHYLNMWSIHSCIINNVNQASILSYAQVINEPTLHEVSLSQICRHYRKNTSHPITCVKFNASTMINTIDIVNNALGWDLIEAQQVKVSDFLARQPNQRAKVVLITPENVLCFEKEALDTIISMDHYDKWMFKCNGPLDNNNNRSMANGIEDVPYVGIPLNQDGMIGYVRLVEMVKMMESRGTFFYVAPPTNGAESMITHSVSWKNHPKQQSNWLRNFVSANHCQSGTSIMVYTIMKCKFVIPSQAASTSTAAKGGSRLTQKSLKANTRNTNNRSFKPPSKRK
jgi:hypothetical protein